MLLYVTLSYTMDECPPAAGGTLYPNLGKTCITESKDPKIENFEKKFAAVSII